MSRTLSILIVENFVINEGPKWEKVKRGANKAKAGVITAATVGGLLLSGRGGYKMYDAPISHQSAIENIHSVYKGKSDDIKAKWSMDIDNIKGDKSTSPETKENLIKELEKNHERDQSSNLDAYRNKRSQEKDRVDNQQKQGKRALLGGLGLAGVSALAGIGAYDPKKSQAKKEEKLWWKEEKQAKKRFEKQLKKEEKQEKKSLKERLELIKSGMFLNEEPGDGVASIRMKYIKGIVDSIKLYSDLLPKARSQYGMNDLVVQLEHHIDEDTKELQDAIVNLNKEDMEELDRYEKSINDGERNE